MKQTDTNAAADNPLAGKVALVTGGASGLGSALCDTLTEVGIRVIVADMNTERAEARAAELRDAGRDAHATVLDVRDPAAAQAVVEQTLSRWGRLDILVNNAGTDFTCPTEDLTPEHWQRVIDTNLNGPFYLSRCALAPMRVAGSGHIINIASTAAKRAWPNAAAYHASKWGVLGLSHALHAELRSQGIKVTAVIAGGMRTPFLLDRFPDLDPELLQDPANVARAIRGVLQMPDESVVAEITVLPMRETSWP